MGMSAHQRIRRKMEENKKVQTAQQNNPETNSGENQTPDFEKMTTPELKEYAKANNIIISGLTKKEDIKARIIETVNTKNGNKNSDQSENEKNDSGNPALEERTNGDDTNGGAA